MTTEATITMTFTGLTDSDAVRRQTCANAVAVTVNMVQRWTEAVEGAARARAAGHPTADPYNAVAAFLSDESGPRSSTGARRQHKGPVRDITAALGSSSHRRPPGETEPDRGPGRPRSPCSPSRDAGKRAPGKRHTLQGSFGD